MKSSRYIRRTSGVWLWRDPIPGPSAAPNPARPASTSAAAAPEYTLSQPVHYHRHLRPRALPTTTRGPPRHSRNPAAPHPDPEPSEHQSFRELHREIWQNFGPKRECHGPESKRRLAAVSKEAARRMVDAPPVQPWRRADFRDGWGWKAGLQKVRTEDWHYSSEVISALMRCGTAEEARRVWGEQGAETVKGMWAPVMLTLLASDLRQACVFLQASLPLSQPRAYVISDSLAYIYAAMETLSPRDREPIADSLCDAVVCLLRDHPERRDLLKQKDVFKLQKNVAPRRLAELYDELRDAGVTINNYTLMHVASSLAKEPSLKRKALEVMAVGLARIRDEPEGLEQDELRRRRWASVFTTILTSSGISVTSQEVISPEEVWDFAIEQGITPNTIQLTALAQSLFAMGQVDAAWRAFDMFAERGIPVDLKLASTLLQGSKVAGSVPHILRALTLIAETRDVDARVGNNILHLLLSLAMSDAPGRGILPSFPLMLRLYSRMFEAGPLDALIPERLRDVVELDASLEDMVHLPDFASSLDKLFPPREDGLLEPTPVTLEVMVLSWICSLKKGFRGPALIALYGHYRGMLQERHPVATEMVKMRNSVIHDMIIKAMSSSPAHLRAALEVISDMLRDYEGATLASREGEEEGEAPVHPRPSSWTWNILLDAWMRHFKQDNVGRIVSLMKRHGVEPSLVTWNTILSRAARARNTQLAVRSAQEIREGGFEPNEWTVRAFSMLVEKESFLSEMQGEGEDDGAQRRGKKGRGKRGDGGVEAELDAMEGAGEGEGEGFLSGIQAEGETGERGPRREAGGGGVDPIVDAIERGRREV